MRCTIHGSFLTVSVYDSPFPYTFSRLEFDGREGRSFLFLLSLGRGCGSWDVLIGGRWIGGKRYLGLNTVIGRNWERGLVCFGGRLGRSLDLSLRLGNDSCHLHVTVTIASLLVHRNCIQTFLTIVPCHEETLLEWS